MINNITLSNGQSLLIGSGIIENLESLQQLIRIIMKQKDQSLANQISNYTFNMEKEVSLFMADTMLTDCITNDKHCQKRAQNCIIVISNSLHFHFPMLAE